MIEGIHHIAIICSDYKRSKHFYTKILGLPVIHEVYREARQSWKLDLQVNAFTQVELFSFPNTPARVSHPEACGLRHLAFRVKKLEKIIAQLQAHEVKVEAIRVDEFTDKRFTFFQDPDGLPIELYEEI